MNFEFTAARRILFGWGKLAELPSVLAGFGQCALLVTGSGGADPGRLRQLLASSGFTAVEVSVEGEPSILQINAALRTAREARCDLVIGFGGGSVLDAAKAVAALLNNPGEVLDYLEVVGKNQPLRGPSLPCVAIPTTAGTGSEVTRNAVLAAPEQKMKVSLRGPTLLPTAALVDPELTLSLPPAVTASTGMDALTQVIEPYVSHRANAVTDLFCREGIQRAARSLRTVYHSSSDPSARVDMSFASLMGGLALANAGLGAVHGFASPIGGMFPVPHGAVCACLLPAVTAANVQAMQSRAPDHPALERYREIACWLTGSERAVIQDGIRWLDELTRDLAIPPLSAYGIRPSDLPAIAEKAASASSMKGNPVVLLPEELLMILEQVF